METLLNEIGVKCVKRTLMVRKDNAEPNTVRIERAYSLFLPTLSVYEQELLESEELLPFDSTL